jgi:hypothetical protein
MSPKLSNLVSRSQHACLPEERDLVPTQNDPLIELFDKFENELENGPAGDQGSRFMKKNKCRLESLKLPFS